MDERVLGWMMEGGPWMRYAAETQLLNRNCDPSPAAQDGNIQAVIRRLRSAQAGIPALTNGKTAYKSPGNAFWDLYFLSDIGLKAEDLGLRDAIESIFELQRPDGTFVLQQGMKPGYFCISAILLSSLARMGYADNARILSFIGRIFETQRLDGGWHCAMNRAVGKPLKDTESCPMDNLNVLMLLGQYEPYRNDERITKAADLLLTHWKRRNEPWRPYGFGIGSDFMKLRYPATVYGIVRVLDVLSLYPRAAGTEAFRDMLGSVLGRASGGKYRAESAPRSYPEFDFGQTKAPSRWLTFLVYRILKRVAQYPA